MFSCECLTVRVACSPVEHRMATLGPGILVEGNSEEESAVLREEILHKAGLLTRFGLQEEIAEQPTQPSLPAPEPAGSDQEDDDTFIVVKSEFLKLEDPELPLSDETLSRLLDVPEAAAVRGNSELAKDPQKSASACECTDVA
ncbi:unnamed protein product [Symbiodinium microadriaticum]|nr:unnamed protein product [Symbiodinium microadriaticum]